MSRLVNGERKITNPKPENAGKLLIFCEGHTEYNYLDYFRNYLANNLRAKYSDIVIEPINAEGNALHVYNYAEEFLGIEENASKYLYYEKHLVFDCDAPDNIQEVITLMKNSENHYILDYSNLLFETWLVMHFQNLEPAKDNSKRAIMKLMREYLDVTQYTKKMKASKGTIGKILGSNGNERIRAAIENAKCLEKYWRKNGKSVDRNIVQMNPAVEIYKLIERLLDEIVYLCG
ncbi:MAG: RloB domain-containing protein [Lachnospiraceae bacterium]|nr:RloB domain-containing protein [Lachnospiraceae bacterium]